MVRNAAARACQLLAVRFAGLGYQGSSKAGFGVVKGGLSV